MNQRSAEAAEFYKWVIDPEERPLFVSDEASVFDLCTLTASDLVQRIGKHYGVSMSGDELRLPLWQLLDLLSERKVRRPD